MNQQVKSELQSLSNLTNQLSYDEAKNARTLQTLVEAEQKAQQDLETLKERLDQLNQQLQMSVGSKSPAGVGGTINQMLQQETSPNLLNTTAPAGGYQGNAYQQYTGGINQQGYYGDAYQQYTGQQYTNQRKTSNTGR